MVSAIKRQAEENVVPQVNAEPGRGGREGEMSLWGDGERERGRGVDEGEGKEEGGGGKWKEKEEGGEGGGR